MSEKQIAILVCYLFILCCLVILTYDRACLDTNSVDGNFKIKMPAINGTLYIISTLISGGASVLFVFELNRYSWAIVITGTLFYPLVLGCCYLLFHQIEKQRIIKSISTSLSKTNNPLVN